MIKPIDKTKRGKKALAFALSLGMLATFGCSDATSASENPASEKTPVVLSTAETQSTRGTAESDTQETARQLSEAAAESSSAVSAGDSAIFSDRDFDASYDASSAATIQFSGSSVQASSNAVNISGSTATITAEGTYIISGTADDGGIIVNVGDNEKVQLVLDGADITSKTSAPIYVKQADKVFITLAEGSTNMLANGGSFAAVDENNIDAVIFSKEDITLNGSGSLEITSPAGHGVVSKDSLRIISGTYTITGASHCLDGNDEVSVANANLILTAGKDGIHSENTEDASKGFVAIENGTFVIDAQGDAVDSSSTVQINGGSFDITTGGGYENASAKSSQGWGGFPGGGMQRNNMQQNSSAENSQTDSTSMKGIKASQVLLINGGDFTLNCADDAFHSNGSAAVRGGIFEIATGDDAFHADQTMSVADGSINIVRSYEGIEGQTIEISGGEVTLYATDDGLNAAGGMDSSGLGGRDAMYRQQGGGSGGSIVISGGMLDITAYGDGIDSNGSLEITGGDIVVSGPTQGDTSTLDTDAGSYISGGTFIGTGAAGGMAQTFGGSAQGLISVNAGNNSAGTKIELTDGSGNIILSYTPQLDFALVILSSPEIVSGNTYTLTVGSQSGQFTAK